MSLRLNTPGDSPLPDALPAGAPRQAVVIDTNIILDVFVFNDAAAKPVRQALEAGELDWIATQPMRDELARVLGYPQIVPRLNFYQLSADDVLASFDRHARLLGEPDLPPRRERPPERSH